MFNFNPFNSQLPVSTAKSTQCVILENLGLSDTVDLAKNALNKNDGGELLSPVKFSGFRKNAGSIVISTQSDGNDIGDA
ncbi:MULTISPECIES: hypothetical protein [Xenorhabdus]|uniref:hypothetical protein n=1 Tax=Xenorhabdus TaxID=626 RepID=UPI00064AC0D2|nr:MULTISPECIES: hypothetical protein [Xenorhabdus]KLU16591.1 hypothetical protein AAY47_04995 [Xenorhabdus griffiniae]KOP32612.1 hypothetical protein AFK69_14405 [Xenorhabdus sp. GDc328]